MTRPRLRAKDRQRCNLKRGLHRLNCRGHAGTTGGASRSESQKARREAERQERRSAAQIARRESEKRDPNPGLSLATMRGYSEGPNRGQTSVDKRPLRPLPSLPDELDEPPPIEGRRTHFTPQGPGPIGDLDSVQWGLARHLQRGVCDGWIHLRNGVQLRCHFRHAAAGTR
jgi:hypothetical protein